MSLLCRRGRPRTLFRRRLNPSPHVGIIDVMSTSKITTASGTNPGLLFDSIALTSSASASSASITRTTQYTPRFTGTTFGALLDGQIATPFRATRFHDGPLDDVLVSELLRLPTIRTNQNQHERQMRHRAALGTSLGSTNSFFVNRSAIGQLGGSFIQVAATLARVSNHGYIWIDNTLIISALTLPR